MTESERFSKITECIQSDMLKAVNEAQKANEPNDFATGYSHAIQDMSMRLMNTLLKTMSRTISGDDISGDILAFYQVQRISYIFAHQMRGIELPQEKIKSIESVDEKFTSTYSLCRLISSLGQIIKE